jgi:glycosyltransferase involved in cell wall biosynthesis
MKSVLCIVHGVLGWRTIAERIADVTSQFEDMRVDVVVVRPNFVVSSLMWQQNSKYYFKRHLPIFDSVSVFARLCGKLVSLTSEYDGVLAMSQSTAGGLRQAGYKGRLVAYVDSTRHLSRTTFGATNVSERREARERSVFQSLDFIVGMSNWVVDDIVGYYGVAREKTSVVYPFTSVIDVHEKNCDVDRKLKLIFVGNDFIRKGGADLLKWQKAGLHNFVELNIVTNDKLDEVAVPGVIFHRGVTNMELKRELLPNVHLIVHPTYEDMSAIVVVEAAAAAIPAVVTNIAGVGELVVHNKTGILVDPAQRHLFAGFIAELANDRIRLSRMSAAARKHSLENFDEQHSVRRLFEIAAG